METRKIIKNGAGTYYVSIPREVMKELRWRERQRVVVRRRGDRVIIEDWGQKRLLPDA